MLTGDPGQSDKVSRGDVALLTASTRLHAFGGQLGDLAGGVVEPQLHSDAARGRRQCWSGHRCDRDPRLGHPQRASRGQAGFRC